MYDHIFAELHPNTCGRHRLAYTHKLSETLDSQLVH